MKKRKTENEIYTKIRTGLEKKYWKRKEIQINTEKFVHLARVESVENFSFDVWSELLVFKLEEDELTLGFGEWCDVVRDLNEQQTNRQYCFSS